MTHHRSEIVVGRLPVLACLSAGKRRASVLYMARQVNDVNDILERARGLPVERVERQALDRIAGGVTHQGVALRAEPLPVLELDAWLDVNTSPGQAVVILDGLEDPQNFGAIARSAAACGVSGLLFTKDRSAPITTAAMKAAAGGMEYIDLIQTTNLSRALDQLKQARFWIAALEADAPRTIWDADLRGRMAFIIGGEGGGIRRLVRKRADFTLAIPLVGAITSLNASVSAGVVLAEWLRQRQG